MAYDWNSFVPIPTEAEEYQQSENGTGLEYHQPENIEGTECNGTFSHQEQLTRSSSTSDIRDQSNSDVFQGNLEVIRTASMRKLVLVLVWNVLCNNSKCCVLIAPWICHYSCCIIEFLKGNNCDFSPQCSLCNKNISYNGNFARRLVLVCYIATIPINCFSIVQSVCLSVCLYPMITNVEVNPTEFRRTCLHLQPMLGRGSMLSIYNE